MPIVLSMDLGDVLVLDGVAFELTEIRSSVTATLTGPQGDAVGIDDESALQATKGVFVQIRPVAFVPHQITLMIDPLEGVSVSREKGHGESVPLGQAVGSPELLDRD